MTFVVRTAADPTSLIPVVRRVITEVDPNAPILDMIMPVAIRDRLMDRERVLTIVLGVFGSIALLLTCLGIYGMLAYSVNRKTSEIGVRMALGALPHDVLYMVFKECLVPVVIGITIVLPRHLP